MFNMNIQISPLWEIFLYLICWYVVVELQGFFVALYRNWILFSAPDKTAFLQVIDKKRGELFLSFLKYFATFVTFSAIFQKRVKRSKEEAKHSKNSR